MQSKRTEHCYPHPEARFAKEKEADVILWDGGNNDLPFFVPDLHIVVTDPLRVGNELTCFHDETNLRLAEIVSIDKA